MQQINLIDTLEGNEGATMFLSTEKPEHKKKHLLIFHQIL